MVKVFMYIMIVILILILAVFSASYYLYRQVFCYPLKKHKDAYMIPENSTYKAYRDIMTESIREMERTPHENVSITSVDGYRLSGELYRLRTDAPLVIFFHGYHGLAAWDGYGIFRICKENGFNILMIDERAHGKSGGRAITFGIKERFDGRQWIEYAVERFGKNTDIFLAGVSMGAATVMMISGLELPGNVKGIVADCGYSEPSAIIKETIRKMHLPVSLLYFFVSLGARLFEHLDLEEATPLEAVQKTNIPILFIHGTKDPVVPLFMNEKLYESCAGKKERVLITGAGHANSALTDYETYEKAVMKFLKERTQE